MASRGPLLTISVVALVVGACTQVLGLEDYSDAVEQLCRCDVDVPQFDGQCREKLSGRLDAVSPERRAEWLHFFAERCADSCDGAFACYQQDATCTIDECTDDRECCGFDAGVRCDTTGRCL